MFLTLVGRDLGQAWGRAGQAWLPLAFFLLAASLFPFAIGPDRPVLERVAPGALWTAALFAAVLPIPTLFEPDRADGTLDQLAVRGLAFETVAAARMLAHWLAFALPLLLATPVAGALLGLSAEALPRTLAALAVGTPGLAALAVMAGALTAGAREAGALAPLIVLPLAVPILIFGAGWAGDTGPGAAKWLGAASLLLVALGPLAAGAALRAGQD